MHVEHQIYSRSLSRISLRLWIHENDAAICSYGSVTLLSEIFISCNFNMLMIGFGLSLPSHNRSSIILLGQSHITLWLRFRIHSYVQHENISRNKNCLWGKALKKLKFLALQKICLYFYDGKGIVS
jgi:hypothetical protein